MHKNRRIPENVLLQWSNDVVKMKINVYENTACLKLPSLDQEPRCLSFHWRVSFIADRVRASVSLGGVSACSVVMSLLLTQFQLGPDVIPSEQTQTSGVQHDIPAPVVS